MTVKIGYGGYLDLLANYGPGPRRKVRIISFIGRAEAGPVIGNGMFPRTATKLGFKAVIDVSDGKNRTTEFSDTGALTANIPHLTQLDTGPSGHTCWAIITDTGT